MTMTRDDALLVLEEFEALVPDGFEDCLVGVVERCGEGFVGAYDVDKVIEKMVSQGKTHEEAWEWFSFNMAGASVGPKGPVWFHGIEN